ncbi:MAG: PHP domain-containing protein [Gemmatimonadota bacterium]|jgi:predicted metal-dependent phosphoesterase TrpH
MRLDLHIHSTASDGALPPQEVLARCEAARLDVIALADHDTTAGVRRLERKGVQGDIQVVPALEVSSTLDQRELHFLGYFVDPNAEVIYRHEERAVRLREKRMRGMIKRLGDQGIEVTIEAVAAAAGPDGTALSRPHLARALVDAGHVGNISEAFDRYIGDGHPAFLPTSLLSPDEAIRLILEAGGIPVWAHPPEDRVESLLPRLVQAGLRGLEVYRPRHPARYTLRLEGLCRAWKLLMTGGSDWHGPDRGSELGDFFVTAEEVAALLEEGGM